MGEELRNDPRVEAKLKVTLKFGEEEFVERFAENISRTGIFIGTKSPLPVGSRVHFEYFLADARQLLRGIGIVRWSRSEGTLEEPAGMGLEFSTLDEETQKFIDFLIEERGEGARPAIVPATITAPTPDAPAPLSKVDEGIRKSPIPSFTGPEMSIRDEEKSSGLVLKMDTRNPLQVSGGDDDPTNLDHEENALLDFFDNMDDSAAVGPVEIAPVEIAPVEIAPSIVAPVVPAVPIAAVTESSGIPLPPSSALADLLGGALSAAPPIPAIPPASAPAPAPAQALAVPQEIDLGDDLHDEPTPVSEDDVPDDVVVPMVAIPAIPAIPPASAPAQAQAQALAVPQEIDLGDDLHDEPTPVDDIGHATSANVLAASTLAAEILSGVDVESSLASARSNPSIEAVEDASPVRIVLDLVSVQPRWQSYGSENNIPNGILNVPLNNTSAPLSLGVKQDGSLTLIGDGGLYIPHPWVWMKEDSNSPRLRTLAYHAGIPLTLSESGAAGIEVGGVLVSPMQLHLPLLQHLLTHHPGGIEKITVVVPTVGFDNYLPLLQTLEDNSLVGEVAYCDDLSLVVAKAGVLSAAPVVVVTVSDYLCRIAVLSGENRWAHFTVEAGTEQWLGVLTEQVLVHVMQGNVVHGSDDFIVVKQQIQDQLMALSESRDITLADVLGTGPHTLSVSQQVDCAYGFNNHIALLCYDLLEQAGLLPCTLGQIIMVTESIEFTGMADHLRQYFGCSVDYVNGADGLYINID